MLAKAGPAWIRYIGQWAFVQPVWQGRCPEKHVAVCLGPDNGCRPRLVRTWRVASFPRDYASAGLATMLEKD